MKELEKLLTEYRAKVLLSFTDKDNGNVYIKYWVRKRVILVIKYADKGWDVFIPVDTSNKIQTTLDMLRDYIEEIE